MTAVPRRNGYCSLLQLRCAVCDAWRYSRHSTGASIIHRHAACPLQKDSIVAGAAVFGGLALLCCHVHVLHVFSDISTGKSVAATSGST